MKNIFLLFAFCLIGATISAQDTTIDSTYMEVVGGVYFNTRSVTYPSGDILITKTRLGTAVQANDFSISRFTEQAAAMAQVAQSASTYRGRISEIIREANAAKLILGISPLDTIQVRNQTLFLVSGWTMKTGAVIDAMVFSVNAQGLLRYKLGADVLKNAILLGPILRLKNYSTTGDDLDLYLLPSGNYTDMTRRRILRKP